MVFRNCLIGTKRLCKTNMERVIEKKYLLPFILITTLFALWGVAANMTDTLLAAFRKVMQMSDTQTTFIQRRSMGLISVSHCLQSCLSASTATRAV